jgi:hypothetical protein
MMSHCPLDGTKQLVRRYRLGQEIFRTRLDSLHSRRDIGIPGEKHDWKRRAKLAQATLQLRTAQTRYPYIEKDTAGAVFVRLAVQQMLGRWIGCDVVARFLQTAFDGRPEGRIVIDDMHKPRQEPLLV